MHSPICYINSYDFLWLNGRATPYIQTYDFYFRDDVSRFASTNSFWNDPLDDKGNNGMGMCIAVDPRSYNYRWNTKYCNGPDTASFVCQIPGRKLTRGFRILKVLRHNV